MSNSSVSGHKVTAVRFILALFFGGLVVFSAMTTFSFFVAFFSKILPVATVGADVAALVSGVVGVFLFDVATVVWLYGFLYVQVILFWLVRMSRFQRD
jgi:hypothetical protein